MYVTALGERDGTVTERREKEEGQKTDMQEELDWGFKGGREVKEPLISRERWNKVTSVPLHPVAVKVEVQCPSLQGFVTC